MRFSHVFLAAFLIMSCNDEKKNDKKKVEDLAKKAECSTLDNFKKECLLGKWKTKSAKLLYENEVKKFFDRDGDQEEQESFSLYQENENIGNIEIEDVISGKILVVNDTLELDDNQLKINNNYNFEKNDKKIKIELDKEINVNISADDFGNKRDKKIMELELVVKKVNGKELILEQKGRTEGKNNPIDYVLETGWIKE